MPPFLPQPAGTPPGPPGDGDETASGRDVWGQDVGGGRDGLGTGRLGLSSSHPPLGPLRVHFWTSLRPRAVDHGSLPVLPPLFSLLPFPPSPITGQLSIDSSTPLPRRARSSIIDPSRARSSIIDPSRALYLEPPAHDHRSGGGCSTHVCGFPHVCERCLRQELIPTPLKAVCFL